MQWKITRLLKSSTFYALSVWYEIILIFTVLPEIKQSFEQRKIKPLVEQDSKSTLYGFICISAGTILDRYDLDPAINWISSYKRLLKRTTSSRTLWNGHKPQQKQSVINTAVNNPEMLLNLFCSNKG